MKINGKIGDRYGKLVIVRRINDIEDSETGDLLARWACRCDCGTEAYISDIDIKKGFEPNCGRYHDTEKDLSGKIYGKLLVIHRGEDHITKTDGKKRPTWLCKCDCGKEILIQTGTLTSGKANSCGCGKQANDLTGNYYGSLRVLGRGDNYVNPKTGKISVKWICECTCGAVVNKFGNNLKAGKGTSCGMCDKRRWQ